MTFDVIVLMISHNVNEGEKQREKLNVPEINGDFRLDEVRRKSLL